MNTMKFTVNQIMLLIPVLSKLGNEELPLKLAINVASILDSFEKPNEIINQRRQKLIDEYAEKDENGDYKHAEDNEDAIIIRNPEEFNGKYADFLNTEIDIEGKSLNLGALEDVDIKITAKDYLILQKAFEQYNKSEEAGEA